MNKGYYAAKPASKKIRCDALLAANASTLSIYPLSIFKKPVLSVLPVHTGRKLNKINAYHWISFLHGTSKNRSTPRPQNRSTRRNRNLHPCGPILIHALDRFCKRNRSAHTALKPNKIKGKDRKDRLDRKWRIERTQQTP